MDNHDDIDLGLPKTWKKRGMHREIFGFELAEWFGGCFGFFLAPIIAGIVLVILYAIRWILAPLLDT